MKRVPAEGFSARRAYLPVGITTLIGLSILIVTFAQYAMGTKGESLQWLRVVGGGALVISAILQWIRLMKMKES